MGGKKKHSTPVGRAGICPDTNYSRSSKGELRKISLKEILREKQDPWEDPTQFRDGGPEEKMQQLRTHEERREALSAADIGEGLPPCRLFSTNPPRGL